MKELFEIVHLSSNREGGAEETIRGSWEVPHLNPHLQVKELVGKSTSEVREGDLAKKFINELEPMTLNHYYLDTYNKIRLASVQAEFVEILGRYEKNRSPDEIVCVPWVSRAEAQAAVVEAFTNLNAIGKSNAEQVVCLNPQP